MNPFTRYQLRTTDVAGATAFYASLFGKGATDIEALPRQALERGAPPHWLGHLAVRDVDQAVRAFGEWGAVQLGPTFTTRGGGRAAVCRDPGGAVLALAEGESASDSEEPLVIWHQLNVADVSRAVAAYGALFGWVVTGQRDHGEQGVHHELAWREGEPSNGSAVDIAGRPGVHPHWLFHFRAPSFELALAKVREQGGVVVGPTRLDKGDLVAMCEDPQGAAFMLRAGVSS